MKRSSTRGITQLELLIALGLMGLMAMLLANTLNFNRLTLERSRLLSSVTEVLLANEQLRDFAEAMPLKFGSQNSGRPFEGDGTSLQFKTLVTDGTFWPGDFVQIDVGLSRRDQVAALILTATGQAVDTTGSRETQSALAIDVSDLRIQYFGRRSAEDAASWQDTWVDTVLLPELVKLEWSDKNGNPMPPLTLRPALIARHKYMSLSSLVPPG